MIATSLKSQAQMIASPPLVIFTPTFENYLGPAGRSRWLWRNFMNSVSIIMLPMFLFSAIIYCHLVQGLTVGGVK